MLATRVCAWSHQAYEHPLLTVLLLKKRHQLLIWWRQQREQSWKERLMKPLKPCPVVREQVESDILPASRSQEPQFRAVDLGFHKEETGDLRINGFFLVHSLFRKIQKDGGVLMLRSCCVWLCMHATGLFNVWTWLRLTYPRWITVHLHAGTHTHARTPRQRRAHTLSFEDLFTRGAVFLNVSVCHRRKRGPICRFVVDLPLHRSVPLRFWIFFSELWMFWSECCYLCGWRLEENAWHHHSGSHPSSRRRPEHWYEPKKFFFTQHQISESRLIKACLASLTQTQSVSFCKCQDFPSSTSEVCVM